MPISDDEEYSDSGSSQMYNSHGQPMSKAEQRRSNKPIMEKRRRARINHCLNELKSLILDAMKKDPARHSKLEKADILEMTVKHLQNVQRQQLSQAVAADPHTLHKFKSGFNECAAEVNRYVSRMDGLDPGVRQRLVAHLSGCVSGLQQLAPFSWTQGLGQGLGQGLLGAAPVLQQVQLAGDINNNSNVSSSRLPNMQGVRLIPSRLPTGEIALLLPNSGQLSAGLSAGLLFPTAAAEPTNPSAPKSHQSAFTAVSTGIRSNTPTSSPSQDEEDQSASASASASASTPASASNSPDTPPSSARALHLARVAADSSTPESSSHHSGRDINANAISSPTSSLAEVKVELKTVPVQTIPSTTSVGSGMYVDALVDELPLGGRNALDFSIKREAGEPLKRLRSDSSETDAEAEAVPSKMPRYTLSVVSAPTVPTAPIAPTALRPATSSTHPHAQLYAPVRAVPMQPPAAVDEKGDMWRPW